MRKMIDEENECFNKEKYFFKNQREIMELMNKIALKQNHYRS